MEAFGVMNAIKSGVSVDSVRKPLADKKVINDNSKHNDYNLSDEKQKIRQKTIFPVAKKI